MAHAAAATEQAFQARTTANAREDTAAVVLSSASRWISKTMKGSQVSMMNKYTLYFLVIYIYIFAYRNGCQINSNSHMFYFLNTYIHLEF